MVTTTALKSSLQTEPDEHQGVEKKIQQFRELFADAPELGKKGNRERASGTQIADFGFAACG